jgi:hypothetical protein
MSRDNPLPENRILHNFLTRPSIPVHPGTQGRFFGTIPHRFPLQENDFAAQGSMIYNSNSIRIVNSQVIIIII